MASFLEAHIQLPSIYSDMNPHIRTPALMLKSVVVAYSMICALYLVVATFGYARFGSQVGPNIIGKDL